MDGYLKFRKWMLEVTEIDVNNCISLPSVTKQYLQKSGCFEGVCELSGIARHFIQSGVVGGRTMLANNKPSIYSTTGNDNGITDFDARGLYASAMSLMKGFIKGKPQMWNSNVNLELVTGYFIEIRILTVEVTRDFPLFNEKVDDVRNFTNEMVGKTIVVDRQSLEDLVEFHQITYEILQGYYFDEGYNTKINEVMLGLVEERQKKKRERNPIEKVYKLLCNSGYGLLTTKAYEFSRHFFRTEEAQHNYMFYNSNQIRSFTKVGKSYEVDSYEGTCGFYNYCHLAFEVLSYSKRIMNKVMCLAQDEHIPIFYQDTDSMHLLLKDVPKLQKAYKDKYDFEIIGPGIGQFGEDFEVNDKERDTSYPIRSVESYFIAKKVYLDKLKYKTLDGKYKYAIHKRLKGIPEKCIEQEATKRYPDLYFPEVQLYEDLYNGESIEFNLLDSIPGFKQLGNLNYVTMEVFKRKICF
jgi:hypothetical protein